MSFDRYERYKNATTLQQFYNAVDRSTKSKPRNPTSDLEWDFCHGFVSFPLNTAGGDTPGTFTGFTALFELDLSYPDSNQTSTQDDFLEETHLAMTATFHSVIQDIWPHDPQTFITINN